MRIVSLIPSATEMICELNLQQHLVGVSHECDFPKSVQTFPRVTRSLIPENTTSEQIDASLRDRLKSEKALYDLNAGLLASLAPDLIVTQTLCDVCAVAEHEVHSAVCNLKSRPVVLNLEPSSISLREIRFMALEFTLFRGAKDDFKKSTAYAC